MQPILALRHIPLGASIALALGLAACDLPGPSDGGAGMTASADSLGTDSMGPDSMGTDSMGPDSMGADSMGPDSMGPDSMGPDSMGPDSTSGGDTGDSGDSSDTADSGDSGVSDGLLDLPATPYNYAAPELPAHFGAPLVHEFDNTPADNQISDAGATLGRVLFYDTELSQNRTLSCGSCHQQTRGFADGEALSPGFVGELTGRSSMSLANARWYPSGRFFWDERAASLEAQVLGPIQSPVEMGMTLEAAVTRVSARPYAAPLFTAAFGDNAVTSDRIARALAQFVRSMTASRSRYDQGLAQAGSITADFANFSAAENLGKQLFLSPRTACAACHLAGPPPTPGQGPGQPPLFANQAIFQPIEPLNNGLDAGPVEGDNGVGDVSGDPADNGLFKSPSLRNIAITGPYMHDGRLATLEAVIDHYDHGVKPHPNLDPRLRGPNNQPRQMNLTGDEKAALVAFLKTLTDEAMIADPRFADPFIH